jgi:hypothetical protein
MEKGGRREEFDKDRKFREGQENDTTTSTLES